MATDLTSVMEVSPGSLATSLLPLYLARTNAPLWPERMVLMKAPGNSLRWPLMLTVTPLDVCLAWYAVMGRALPVDSNWASSFEGMAENLRKVFLMSRALTL